MQHGYQPDFIGDGIVIPLPAFKTPLNGSVLRDPDDPEEPLFAHHPNFTIVMNRHTRQLIYSACNIDQSLFKPKAGGETSWDFDDTFDEDRQLGNRYYKDRRTSSGRKIENPYDRGHMVMRFNNMWGETEKEADEAGKSTFIYSNASLQHKNLNQDEWRALEMEIVRKLQHDANNRLSLFTGPIYGDLDRHINLGDDDTARVPSGFFKVICFRLKGGTGDEKLGVYAFAVFQDAKVLRDRRGHATIKTDRNYQVTIRELQDLTSIDFGETLFNRNPLFYFDRDNRDTQFNVSFFPERIPVNRTGDVVRRGDTRRDAIEPLSRRRIAIMSAMVDPVGDETKGEWITLFNRSADSVDLTGWTLVDGAGRSADLSSTLEPGTSLKLLRANLGTIRLGNRGGSLMLRTDEDRIMDHVTWSRQDIQRLGPGVAFIFERGQ